MDTLQFLLKYKLNSLKNEKRNEFLIDCIHKHKPMGSLDKKNINTSEKLSNICEKCGTNEFNRTKFEEICAHCGLVKMLEATERTYKEKTFEYIQPGKNIVKVKKDGKNISVDLTQINLWLQEKDPFSQDIRTINNSIDELNININYLDEIKKSAIGLFYYLIEVNKGAILTKYKKGILGLCIYYSGIMNNIKIDLKNISNVLRINISEIYKSSDNFKDILKDTNYSYLNLELEIKCDIKLNQRSKLLFNKIKSHLINKNVIKEPISNKYYSGIIYYICQKKKCVEKYTLDYLSKECNISTTGISETYKKIVNFFNNNPTLT